MKSKREQRLAQASKLWRESDIVENWDKRFALVKKKQKKL
jgi:hypothetical protein